MSNENEPIYRGRFAPSPTGPLHFGSLVAAVGSFLNARSRGGQWRVRIEDLDTPRRVPGAAERILRTLEAFAMTWDGPVMYQSARREAYVWALERLCSQGAVYACGCSRREIADSGAGGLAGTVYPGTCRRGLPAGRQPRALRVRVDDRPIAFADPVQGHLSYCLEKEVGDFVVRRADGLFAYQLAVVVDDAEQGITEVVRGADLLDSTPRQIYLQRLLGLPTPQYLHLPLALDAAGQKLSKQTRAVPLDEANPVPVLVKVLAFLGQPAPTELAQADTDAFWHWAVAHWRSERIPRAQPLPTYRPR